MKNFMKRLWTDEGGQSTTEYILMVAVVVMVAMKFKTVFQQKIDTLVNGVGTKMEEATR